MKLEAGDVVKIDLGCYIDGYVALAANTIVIPDEKMTEEKKAEIVPSMFSFNI